MEIVKTAPCGEGAAIAQITGNSERRFKTELERAKFMLAITQRRYAWMLRSIFQPKTLFALEVEARKEHARRMFSTNFAQGGLIELSFNPFI